MNDWSEKDANDSAPQWYQDCFRMALLRVAAAVNSRGGPDDDIAQTCRRVLAQKDEELFNALSKNGLASKLANLHVGGYDHLNFDSEYNAENFFYSNLEVSDRKGHRILRYYLTQTFLDWSYRRLHKPRASDEDLGRKAFKTEESFIFGCATNYIVKNLWHNYVHVVMQGITAANYHEFKGGARYDSDFEADNLATLLLIRSYGLPVKAVGGRSEARQARIEELLRRNVCNQVFAERALHRKEDRVGKSQLELFHEGEWMFFRRICNRLSGTLAAHGLAARSLSVFANGTVKIGRRVPFRKGNVVLQINGRRYYTPYPVYVPAEETLSGSISPQRRSNIDKTRRQRIGHIVGWALAHYRDDLRKNKALRADAENQLASLWERLGIAGD